MGINNVTFQAISSAMKMVTTENPKVLSLGYPDFLADNVDLDLDVKMREDSYAVCSYHGLEPRLIPETYSVFKSLGWELTVTDFRELRNESRYGDFFACDLNKYNDRPLDYTKRFDLVLDCGTMEHIMNMGACLKFIYDMCDVGGYIFHANPMQQQNHGFWSFSPTFYNDMYVPVNGCDVVAQIALNTDDQQTVIQVPPTGRFRVDGEWNILTLVKKTEHVFREPQIQTKYKKMLGAA